MDRREVVDRIALLVFVVISLFGLVLFRVGVGWHVTDPYIAGTVVDGFPPTAWVSIVPLFVVLGVLAALFIYRKSGVRMPGSR